MRAISRRRSLPPLLIALLAASACAPRTAVEMQTAPTMSSSSGAADASPLDGAWELLSSRIYRGDSLLGDFHPPQLRSLKVLANSRFSFVTNRDDGTLAQAGAGRFSARDGNYTESIELSSMPARRGQTYSFTYQVSGDLWRHRGMVGDLRFEEEWRRVTP